MVLNDAVDGVSGFCSSFHPTEDASVAVFQVHCDESGKLEDSQCVVFAACVFPQDEVMGFQRKWNELLSDAGVRFLHMKDAMRCEGEFKGWSDRKSDRDDLLVSLARLLLDRSAWLNVSPMSAAEFHKLPQQQQKRLKNVVYAGFEALLTQISSDAVRHKKPQHRFHLVYDLSEQYSTQCLKLFNKLRMMNEAYRQFFPSLTFADDEEFAPIQGADMLGFVRKEKFLGKADESSVTAKILDIFSSIRVEEASAIYLPGASLGDAFMMPE